MEESVVTGPQDTADCGSVVDSEAGATCDLAAGGDQTLDTEAAVYEELDLSECSNSPSNTDGESSADEDESLAEDSGNRTSQM